MSFWGIESFIDYNDEYFNKKVEILSADDLIDSKKSQESVQAENETSLGDSTLNADNKDLCDQTDAGSEITKALKNTKNPIIQKLIQYDPTMALKYDALLEKEKECSIPNSKETEKEAQFKAEVIERYADIIAKEVDLPNRIPLATHLYGTDGLFTIPKIISILESGVKPERIIEFAARFIYNALGKYALNLNMTKDFFLALLQTDISATDLITICEEPVTRPLFLKISSLPFLVKLQNFEKPNAFQIKAFKCDPSMTIEQLYDPNLTEFHIKVMDKIKCKAKDIMHLHGTQLTALLMAGIEENQRFLPYQPFTLSLKAVDVDWWTSECTEYLLKGFSYAEITEEFREKNKALLQNPESFNALSLKEIPCVELMRRKAERMKGLGKNVNPPIIHSVEGRGALTHSYKNNKTDSGQRLADLATPGVASINV